MKKGGFMYQLLRVISFFIRAYLCYCTIDNIPILANPILNSILGQVISLYTILWAISYFIVGKFYDKGSNPLLGVILYFIVYIIILGITYLLLLLLTFFGILPITI